jgi:perosamine synthetase
MSNLEENLLKRYLIFEAYNEAFLNTSGIKVLYDIPRNNYSPWLYSLLLDAHLDRDRVIYLLQKNGIETRPFFAPHSESGRFKPDQKCNFQNSISISNSGINLPTYSHLAHTDIEYIARVAKSIFAL